MSARTASDLDAELAHHLAGERAHTVETILLIAEIDRRRTFVELGFSSAWDYLRRVHKQSDTMIHYRLSCARAINRYPQVLPPLRDGRLCMTTLAELTKAMNETNCDELLAQAVGKSRRDVERLVATQRPQPVPKDVTRPVNSTFLGKCPPRSSPEQPSLSPASTQPVQTEILTESLARKHMTVDREFEDLLRQARAMLSHKMPAASELDILKEGLRQIIREGEKRRGVVNKPRPDKKATGGDIPQSVKRTVWKRDQGKCQWRSADGEICGSTHRVEFHHKQDRGRGGLGSADNVMLLCKTHNQLAAEMTWGEDYLACFRNRPSVIDPQPETG